MKEKKTPGSTPGRTPKGFRALFSLWESKREGRSPLRRGKSASQADVPEVAASPLRPLGDLPTEPSETPNGNEPLLNASSPAMLMAARTLLSSSLTWSATPQDSASKQRNTTETGNPPHVRGQDQVVNHESVEIDLSKDHKLRNGNSETTPTMGTSMRPSVEKQSLPHNLSTPQVNGDRPASRTPTEIGLTPPTLSAHNPFPAGTPVVASASDDCSASDAGMSSKFSTCDEGSVEQSPGGSGERQRLQHAGHTPAPKVPASQTPCPPSDGALPPHHPCDADLDRSASVAELVFEAADDLNAAPAGSPQDAFVNILDAPVSSQPAAALSTSPQSAAVPASGPAPHSHAPPLPEPHTRPEVSSPIIESLERSGGSDALARAGSSGVLRSGSSGPARAISAPAPSGDAPVRHRHQRSGALDFDSALLLTSVEDGSASAGARVSPTDPAPLDVSTGGQDGDDVRGSDDSVVLHPTPGAGKEAGNIAAGRLEDSTPHIAELCPLGQASPAGEIVPADVASPEITGAAPSDGIIAVAPPAAEPQQHTAPVTTADVSTPSLPELMPGTPPPTARAAEDPMDAEMAGVTPFAEGRDQDSIMAGTTPNQNDSCAFVASPQPVAHTAELDTGSPDLPGLKSTCATDMDVPMCTPGGEGSPGASAELFDQDAQMDSLSTAPPTEIMTGPGTSIATCSVTPETATATVPTNGTPIEASAVDVPEQDILPPAESPADVSGGQAQALSPETAAPPVPIVAAVNSASLTLVEAGPQQVPGSDPDGPPQAEVDVVAGPLATPASAEAARLVEGTPCPSPGFAPNSVQCVSVGDTPTEVQLSRCRGLIADGTSAFQVSNDASTPTSADPAIGDLAIVRDGAFGEDGARAANDASVPLSEGSAPLAMAPSDMADCPAALEEAAALGEGPAERVEAPLPMLSPVQDERPSPAKDTDVAPVMCVDCEGNGGESSGGDENARASPHTGGATAMTCSHFQVPTEAGDAGGASAEPPADLAMECSDAVVEHDEDSCTRIESPVPPAIVPAGADAHGSVSAPAAEGTPCIADGDRAHTDEPALMDSGNADSAAAVPKEFALCSPLRSFSGVRESTDSKYAPSGTDSILGIASGICGAAVAGALTSNSSLRNSQVPLSPAGAEGFGDPGPPRSILLASPMSEVPMATRECDQEFTDGSTPAQADAAAALGTAEVRPTPPDSGRPSLRRDRATPSATPPDTVLHPISSSSFRVTDSCADRVWRMLQGTADSAAAAAAPPRMTPTAEEVQEDGAGGSTRDSLTVPDFPSLDEAAYAQLEREALQASDSAELSLQPADGRGAAERPSTPPAPLQVDVPQSGAHHQTGPGDSPHLQPTFCDSPGVPARRSSRRSGSASHQQRSDRATPLSIDGTDDLRQTAITDTLVNQSLTASLMFPAGTAAGAEGEILLESMLEGDSAEPEALPSPTQLKAHSSPLEISARPHSSGWAGGDQTALLPGIGPVSGGGASKRASAAELAERSCPATSTFDAAAIVSKSEKRRAQRRQSGPERPRTAGVRHTPVPGPRAASKRPSTSSALSSRRASQTPSLTTPLTAQHMSSNPVKRSLSHKTIHNISPNHNPNYRPHSPGKTPQAVPPNPSPYAKRCRSHGVDGVQRLDQPLDIGCDLPDVDDMAVLEPTSAKSDSQGQKPARSPSHNVKVTPPLARPARERAGVPASAQNLRDSLLTLDPMRLSYGPDGLVNLAGDEDKVLFQADIEAITQALDTYPSQGDVTNENSSAQPRRPGNSASPKRGVSPLRLSSVRKQRAPGGDTPKVGADCDVEDLRLQLAVAVRQAEHFRRENATLQERSSLLQEYIEAETFLGSGQDNTETLLAEVSPEARKEEAFASERSEMQAQITMLKSKCEDQRQHMHVLLTQQLPAAHAASERAEKELAAERARSAAAAEAATAALAQEQSRLKQAKHEAGKLRTDLERHATKSAEATQSRRRLEDALAKAQAATEAAEGRYQTKCKELSMTKLAKPTGIGGGIGATKLKQDLAAVTAERDAVKAQVRELQGEVGHLTKALHAKESEYEQLSHSFHQALSRWESRGS